MSRSMPAITNSSQSPLSGRINSVGKVFTNWSFMGAVSFTLFLLVWEEAKFGYRHVHFLWESRVDPWTYGNIFATLLDLMDVPTEARVREYPLSLFVVTEQDSADRYYVGGSGMGDDLQPINFDQPSWVK
jgi:hypothetical protein